MLSKLVYRASAWVLAAMVAAVIPYALVQEGQVAPAILLWVVLTLVARAILGE